MTKYTYSEELISDLHKDAWGHRPTPYFWHIWDNGDKDFKQKKWNELIDDMEKNQNEEEKRKKNNATKLAKRIKEVCKLGAKNYRTAIRWILEADGYNEDRQCLNDAGYLCYLFGIDYKFEKVFYHILDIKCEIKWSRGRAFI